LEKLFYIGIFKLLKGSLKMMVNNHQSELLHTFCS